MNPQLDYTKHLTKHIKFEKVSLPDNKLVYYFNEDYGEQFEACPYATLSFKFKPTKITDIKEININISQEIHIQAVFYWVSEERATMGY